MSSETLRAERPAPPGVASERDEAGVLPNGVNGATLDGARAGGEPVALLPWHDSLIVGAAACIALGVLETAKAYAVRRYEGSAQGLLYSAGEQMPWWLLWIALLPPVFWLARSYRFDAGEMRRSIAVHAAAGVVVSLTHVVVAAIWIRQMVIAAGGQAPTVHDEVRLFVLRFLFTDIVTYCAAVGVYYAFEYSAGFRRSTLAAASAEARAARLQLNLVQARLHALRMELNPHFLFNALNSVAGLIRRREPNAAIEMLARLGDLLRATLGREMPDEVTLEAEIDLVRHFIDIELVRFGDRLRVSWEVDPALYPAMVPPLILQPLVENALRHGIARRSGPGVIRICVARVGAHLELSVHDTGEGLGLLEGGAPREGIGLSNIRARLAELYGAGAATLALRDEPDGGACARMLIPFHSAEESIAVASGA